jgi:hypothetical protein
MTDIDTLPPPASREKLLRFIYECDERSGRLIRGWNIAISDPDWLTDEQIRDIASDVLRSWRSYRAMVRWNRNRAQMEAGNV